MTYMNTFTAADRKFLIKLARKLQGLESDVKALKKTSGKTAAQLTEDVPPTVNIDTFDVVFGKNVEWTPEEKEFALKSLYQAIRALCEDTGIIKLSLNINIPQDGL